jgi:DNA-binding transcriptional ArsR family regulator
MIKLTTSPFGSATRSRVLLALRLLGSSYPRELARLLDAHISGVLKALASLEADGLIAGREVGRTRQYSLNPSFIARKELASLLGTLADADADLHKRTAALRRRPRRAGKPV